MDTGNVLLLIAATLNVVLALVNLIAKDKDGERNSLLWAIMLLLAIQAFGGL